MKNGQKNYDRIMRSENYTRTKGKWDTRRRETIMRKMKTTLEGIQSGHENIKDEVITAIQEQLKIEIEEIRPISQGKIEETVNKVAEV